MVQGCSPGIPGLRQRAVTQQLVGGGRDGETREHSRVGYIPTEAEGGGSRGLTVSIYLGIVKGRVSV